MLKKFTNSVIPAPLAGITNEPFRLLLKELGAEITWTEMVSSEALVRNQEKTIEMIKIKEEKPIIVLQLFGANPEVLFDAAKKSYECFGYEYLDINMGCPVKKITKKGAGVALMSEPAKVTKIISNIKKLPITLFTKIRLGQFRENKNFFQILEILYKEGADAVTIHPRSADDFFKGKADWEYIKLAKEKYPSLFIIGNGDIFSIEDIEKMKNFTKCNAVMVGRQIAKDPFFIKNYNYFKQTSKIINTSLKDKIHIFKTLLYKLIEFYDEKKALNLAKKYLILFTKGYPHSSAFRKKILKIKKCIEILNEIEYWVNNG